MKRSEWIASGLLNLALALPALGQAVPTMEKTAKPVFDVAAIKRTPEGERRQGFSTRGHRVVLTRQTVGSMIMFAYAVHHKQIVGGPAWIEEDAYDVDGVADIDGEPNGEQMRMMVKDLLAKRFGLKLHPETRDLAYYSLKLLNGGPKLAKAAHPEQPEDQSGNGSASGMRMKFTNNSMDDFTLGLQFFMDKPVVNETGLPGHFDFELKWTPDIMKVADGDAPPSLLTAVREQLGLKLEAAKGPVNVFVVDAVERPSEN